MKDDKLNRWLETCIQAGQWQNNDLHIDEIYGKTSRKLWIKQGLELLELAKQQVDKEIFTIILSIPLKEINDNHKDTDHILFDLLSEIDLSSTPPSLYIIEKNWQPWSNTLSNDNMISSTGQYHIFFSKFMEDDLVYRWIYVVPQDL